MFKKALKHLLNAFKSKNRLKLRKYELEQKFYDYYFKEVFEKEGITELYLSGSRDKKKQEG